MVVGVVQRQRGEDADDQQLIDHVRSRLAPYKAPRRIISVDTIGRAPNGKVDFKRLRQHAIDQLTGDDR